ncbi:hypothetical protein D8Y22_05720 [Salinadaptatus halalkaliphilus]|uniref:HTH domain protein n=1 Tax=Salinadaptatus halalkaliphilus TaxID=2419781 RepID=A0A4S3TQX0_9EURY|nr:hypothetical protein [Salinadaptatus halalkaliphilus]THE65675.1 hypothetical protein D8Y22_05720 [Salinadaptatus halalkaliphilus]
MDSNTLDDLGRKILERAASRGVSPADLAAALEAPREAIDERLVQLVDNALLQSVDDSDIGDSDVADGEFELTRNGHRVLHATPIGRYDDRIDTPARVEDALESFELRADEDAAVRSVVSALRYWGEATTAELIDKSYTEVPAGYDSADRWWEDLVRDRLEVLPDVELLSTGPVAESWRYDGEAALEQSDRDGREVPDPGGESSVGSVRHALETADLTEAERTAARVAFATLVEHEVATETMLADAVFEDHPAGYDSREAWTAWLAGTFDDAPGIDRLETDQGPGWRYEPAVAENDE